MFTATGQHLNAVVTGVVTDQFGSLPGAKVAIEGSPVNVTSGIDGEFYLELEPGKYRLKASFVMYQPNNKDIELHAGDSLSIEFHMVPGFSIDQPVAIGSRAKPRTLSESTVPIDVISPQHITNSSQIELGQIMQYLLPSFHSTHQTISDGTDFIDPSTLRGLGPDQVLILINGKRRHSSSLVNVNGTVGRGSVSTDFNAIPVAAIDRIEVLRDGAAAQYGSDAIAGVINIILKEQDGLISVDNHVGINSEGDGFSTASSVNFGFDVGQGFVNVTGEFRQRNATNRAGNYTGSVFDDDPDTDQQLIAQNQFFEQNDYDDQQVMEIGNSETNNLGFFFNAEVPISQSASFYGFGGRNYREGFTHGFYRFPKDPQRVVLELYPNGFSPQMHTEITDDQLTLGIRGFKNNWNIDFSNSSSGNNFDFNVSNSNNASLGIATPTKFYSGGFVYRQNTSNIDFSRTLNYFNGINLGFGAELRVENYKLIAGEELSYQNGGDSVLVGTVMMPRVSGAQLFPGFQPDNQLNRTRYDRAMYVDVEALITERAILGIAGRYESFSDFGGQAIWKLSGRYRFNKDFSMSGGYATGFRAPSLHQSYFSNISTQFVNGEALRVGTFNNESAVTKAFGISELKPEISSHLSLGVATKIGSSFTFLVDYYHIIIEDRIVLSGRFEEGYEDILEPLGVGAAQFFTNALDSKTHGVDFRLSFRETIGPNSIHASVAGNFTQTKVDGNIKVPVTLVGQESTLFNREEISRVESAQPNFKIVQLSEIKISKVSVFLNNTLFGKVRYIHPGDSITENWVLNEFTQTIESRDQVFNPKLVTDISFSWQFNNNVKLYLGGNNVLNVYPDKHKHSANVDHGQFVYSRRVQQFGVKGSYFFVRLRLTL